MTTTINNEIEEYKKLSAAAVHAFLMNKKELNHTPTTIKAALNAITSTTGSSVPEVLDIVNKASGIKHEPEHINEILNMLSGISGSSTTSTSNVPNILDMLSGISESNSNSSLLFNKYTYGILISILIILGILLCIFLINPQSKSTKSTVTPLQPEYIAVIVIGLLILGLISYVFYDGGDKYKQVITSILDFKSVHVLGSPSLSSDDIIKILIFGCVLLIALFIFLYWILFPTQMLPYKTTYIILGCLFGVILLGLGAFIIPKILPFLPLSKVVEYGLPIFKILFFMILFGYLYKNPSTYTGDENPTKYWLDQINKGKLSGIRLASAYFNYLENLLMPGILPITILIGLYLFYKETTTDKIKNIILFIAFLAFIAEIYVLNPGNLIVPYVGTLIPVTIVIGIIGICYIIYTICWYEKPLEFTKSIAKPITEINPISYISLLLFIIFFIITVFGLYFFPDKTSVVYYAAISLTIIIFSLWFISLFITLIPQNVVEIFTSIIEALTELLQQRITKTLFGFIFSGFFLYWIIKSILNLTTTSSGTSQKERTTVFVINLFLILSILGLLYKIAKSNEHVAKSPLLSILTDIVLYIPCLFTIVMEYLISAVTSINLQNIQNIQVTNKTIYIKLLVGIVIIFGVFILIYQQIHKSINSSLISGGNLLLQNPVSLNEHTNLGNFYKLNDLDSTKIINLINYQFAMSCWVYLESTNTNSVDTYIPIMNYANSPIIQYNSVTNTMQICTTLESIQSDQKGAYSKSNIVKTSTGSTTNIDPTNQVSTPTTIIYEQSDILLQKWNNIIMNFNGGSLDIFYNGELVNSQINVIPNYSVNSELIAGFDNGLRGGICSVVYYKENLNIGQVQNIYNSLKNLTPPILTTPII
jgi:hypothetical protein